MKQHILWLLPALTLASAATAQPNTMVLLKDDSAVTWGPAPASLPKGLQFSVLAGNPDKPGPFTLRLKIPANFVIPPHTQATSENLTVLGQVEGKTSFLKKRSKKLLSGCRGPNG